MSKKYPDKKIRINKLVVTLRFMYKPTRGSAHRCSACKEQIQPTKLYCRANWIQCSAARGMAFCLKCYVRGDAESRLVGLINRDSPLLLAIREVLWLRGRTEELSMSDRALLNNCWRFADWPMLPQRKVHYDDASEINKLVVLRGKYRDNF